MIRSNLLTIVPFLPLKQLKQSNQLQNTPVAATLQKALSRATDAVLHGAEVLFALAAAGAAPKVADESTSSKLQMMREAQALFQVPPFSLSVSRSLSLSVSLSLYFPLSSSSVCLPSTTLSPFALTTTHLTAALF